MLRRSKGIPRGGRLSNEQAQELPLVRQWSDLVWLAWTSLARTPGTGPGQLKYIFKQHVVTQETVTVIEDVFDLEEDEMPNPGTADWPGEKFTPGKDGFWALLGTPHGLLAVLPSLPYYSFSLCPLFFRFLRVLLN